MKKDLHVSTNTQTKRIGLVEQKDDYGFKQVFPYQKALMSSLLWTSKDSILRIVPGNNGTDTYKQVINGDRYTTDGDQTEFLSDTFYMTQTLNRFGESGLNICANLKPGSEEAMRYPESPLTFFTNTISRVMRSVAQGKTTTVKYNDMWRAWTNLGGILSFPRATMFFQAVCVQVNGRPCKESMEDDAKEAPLYGIIGINHKQSINALLKALVEPMNKRKPWSPDNSDFGALAEPQGNMLYLNSKLDAEGKKYLKPSLGGPDVPDVQAVAQSYPIDEAVCKAIWIPWEKVFNYLTVKEQLELLAQEFGADTVNYVFSLNRAWSNLDIPERIKAAGMGRYGDGKRPTISLSGLNNRIHEPTFNSPGMMNKMEIPEPPKTAGIDMAAVQAEIAKIQAATGTAKSSVADDLLGDLDDIDLG